MDDALHLSAALPRPEDPAAPGGSIPLPVHRVRGRAGQHGQVPVRQPPADLRARHLHPRAGGGPGEGQVGPGAVQERVDQPVQKDVPPGLRAGRPGDQPV